MWAEEELGLWVVGMLSEHHWGEIAGLVGCNLSVGNKPLGRNTREAPTVFQKNTELPAVVQPAALNTLNPATPSHPFPASTAGKNKTTRPVKQLSRVSYQAGRGSRGASYFFFLFPFYFSTRNADILRGAVNTSRKA